MMVRSTRGHLVALVTVIIWGVTFISTKVLLEEFSPVEILFYRFCIGFLLLLAIQPDIVKFRDWKQERLFAELGATGIVIYFLMENVALEYTQAANVGLLVSAAPIFTALLAHWMTRDEKLSSKLWIGFIAAGAGIFLVIFNGSLVLHLNPWGDLLAVLAALAWAIYSILLKKVNPELGPFYVTGRSFGYGILLTLPLNLLWKDDFLPARAFNGRLAGNLLFLGLIASALCYALWNHAVKLIGAVKANNYIYLIPLVAMLTSVIVLREQITGMMVLGGVLILSGVYIGEKV
ncbi:MAG TPA: DMT family transporter [Bacillota bacterium]|nr:DMT family transporter [Bacillota bacterium]